MRQPETAVTMVSGNDRPQLSSSQAVRDSALGDGLTTLVSALEQLLTRLSERACQQDPLVALEVLTDMVEYAASFAEHLARCGFATPSLERVLRKAGARDPSQSFLQSRDNRLGDQLTVLYAQWPGRPEQRASTFRGIAENLIEAVEFYLAAFTLQFRSSSLADQWGDISATLVADSLRAIEGICF